MSKNKITKRDWIAVTLIVILLSAIAGEMDKQDYNKGVEYEQGNGHFEPYRQPIRN